MSNQTMDEVQQPDPGVRLTPQEKALRDKFVQEYLVDYDSYAACVRIGYPAAYAKEYHVRFMNEPYVLQQIKKQEGGGLEDGASEEETVEAARKRIIAGLIREANYRGPGSSQAARVAALSKLSNIYGLDGATKTINEHTGADGQPLGAGVFVVPGIMTVEQWEKAAAAQQDALTKDDTAPSAPVPANG